jgi:hypothetical protein
LTIDLATRYEKSKAGGAFDARAAGIQGGQNNPVDNFPNDAAVGFTLDKRNQIMISDFKDVKNNNSGLSLYLKGFNNTKYKQ